MAFCPNCGTPNTDQAEKCVSCSFELTPKQKSKFKGTIMMQGVQLPASPAKPEAQPAPAPAPTPAAPAAAPAAAATAPATGKSAGFEKTMLGGPGIGGLPPAGAFGSPDQPAADLGRAATIEGARAGFEAKPAPSGFTPTPAGIAATQLADGQAKPAAQQFGGAPAGSFGSGGFANTGSFGGGGSSTGGFGNTGGFGDTGGFGSSPPQPKTNTGKVIAIGCAAALTIACVLAGLVYSLLKEKISGMSHESAGKETAALEWRGSVTTALIQIAALCQGDCQTAAVYFHPNVQSALLNEAKLLTAVRATKLADPSQSQAAMLDGTDDSAIATKLQLDPAQCVRVVAGSAKVVGCSVPTPGGQPNLRIVHLEGLGSL